MHDPWLMMEGWDYQHHCPPLPHLSYWADWRGNSGLGAGSPGTAMSSSGALLGHPPGSPLEERYSLQHPCAWWFACKQRMHRGHSSVDENLSAFKSMFPDIVRSVLRSAVLFTVTCSWGFFFFFSHSFLSSNLFFDGSSCIIILQDHCWLCGPLLKYPYGARWLCIFVGRI